MTATSDGTLLAGKVFYRQLQAGHRSGFEPVLLAAAIPAQAGETVLELGTGAGAGLLCLAWRVPGVIGIGVEIDLALVRLAAANFRHNGFTGALALRGDAAALPFGPVFDHVFANPPWHDPAATASPDPRRALAHRATDGLLAGWIAAMAKALKPGGSLSLILPAASQPVAVAALAVAGYGPPRIMPLLPRLGRPPKQIILQSRAGQTASPPLPGLVLHDAHGITPAADAVLRNGAALT